MMALPVASRGLKPPKKVDGKELWGTEIRDDMGLRTR